MKKLLPLFIFLLVPGFAFSQGLGEAARKEKERRQKNRETGAKVRTVGGDEVNTDTEGDSASPPPSTSPAGATGTKPAAASEPSAQRVGGGAPTQREKTGAKSEQEWRYRIAQARSQKEKAEERYRFLSGLSLVNGEYYVDESGKPVITSLEQLRRMTAEAKADVDATAKAVSAVEDEARRAGVPPGWLR